MQANPTNEGVIMVLTIPSFKPDISLVGDDLYCVLSETDTLGYVHKVGNVFVALSGDNLGHAVEAGQSLSWDQAVEMVLRY
jgi:hypothetical protein